MRKLPLLRHLALGAGLLVGLPGCSGDQPGQIENIQLFARALRSKAPRMACAVLVPKLQDEINCDSLVVPLLHYSPGFAGGKITRRGRASGWRLSQRVTVPVRYEGAEGSGNAEVTLQKIVGQWRIALITPAP